MQQLYSIKKGLDGNSALKLYGHTVTIANLQKAEAHGIGFRYR
jgi:hypothetical protein